MPRLRKHAGRRPSALVPRVLFVGELRRPARSRKRFAGQLATVAASALALGQRRPLLFELTYFWGLTASLQGVLTPGLGEDDRFPSFLTGTTS